MLLCSGISGTTAFSGMVPTVAGASFVNMPPLPLSAGSGLMPGVSHPLLNVGNGNWIPSASEFEIWIAPAGWAEAAYLNGERIDGEDPLSFLDKLEGTNQVEITCDYHNQDVVKEYGVQNVVAGRPSYTVTISSELTIEKKDKYTRLFPLDGTRRDIVIQVTSITGKNMSRTRHACGVIANALIVRREVNFYESSGGTHEAVTLMGDGYFPIERR